MVATVWAACTMATKGTQMVATVWAACTMATKEIQTDPTVSEACTTATKETQMVAIQLDGNASNKNLIAL